MSKTNKNFTILAKRKERNTLHLECATSPICFGMLSERDKKYLAKKGIDPTSVPDDVYSIDLCCLNKALHGIGIRNIRGGVEFIILEKMKRTATVHKKGITVFRTSTAATKSCCLFANLMDYLAYHTLLAEGKVDLPKGCDCILLNHTHNLPHFLVESEDYEKVNLLLPNTPAGYVLAKTIMDRSVDVVDYSERYEYFRGLSEYVYFNNLKSKK